VRHYGTRRTVLYEYYVPAARTRKKLYRYRRKSQRDVPCSMKKGPDTGELWYSTCTMQWAASWPHLELQADCIIIQACAMKKNVHK
jgi:hypothetical protein